MNRKGLGSISTVVAGMDYVRGNHKMSKDKPKIINTSLAGDRSPALDKAVARLYEAGIPIIVAAGNDKNVDACTGSPSGTCGAFAVQAIDIYDTIASFASYGKCISMFAPGVNIMTALLDMKKKNLANPRSGSSMASPHVAGVAAVMMSRDVNLKTTEQVYQKLREQAIQGAVKGDLKGAPNVLIHNGFLM